MNRVNLNLHRFLHFAEDHATIRSSANAPRKQGLNILVALTGTLDRFIEAIRFERVQTRERINLRPFRLNLGIF